MKVPSYIQKHVDNNVKIIEKYSPKLAKLYANCYPNTIDTAIVNCKDGSLFVLTGDIPAMWLRDSTAQVTHYVPLAANDSEVAELIKGVLKRQFMYILIDPYANSFNKMANNHGHKGDRPRKGRWVWERKYEVDSLCYPIRLLDLYIKATNDTSVIDDCFKDVANTIIDLWITEQNHIEKSPYRFVRKNCPPTDTLENDGMGKPVSYTGMTWSGFRPSDDACHYGYMTASNYFAIVTLDTICKYLPEEKEICQKAQTLAAQIKEGLEKFAVIDHPKYGKMLACETDGLGNHALLDDANVPSLLSLPYLGCIDANDELYKNTRRFVLSTDNPFYYEGKFAHGIGSPHTPDRYIWHIALSMQGLTSTNPDEIRELLSMIENTDADTGYMHEGFFADDPSVFTRPWFTWSNSLFAEFVEHAINLGIIK